MYIYCEYTPTVIDYNSRFATIEAISRSCCYSVEISKILRNNAHEHK